MKLISDAKALLRRVAERQEATQRGADFQLKIEIIKKPVSSLRNWIGVEKAVIVAVAVAQLSGVDFYREIKWWNEPGPARCGRSDLKGRHEN